jgi:predicted nucleic acid-binding Zn ribbon protein
MSSNSDSNSSYPKKRPFRPFQKKQKRESVPMNAADVLTALLQNSKSQLADGFTRWRLEQAWPQIVGQSIADQTLPAKIDRGTLYVWVRHPVWMQQLYYFQEPIKEKVNAHLGRALVEQVRFTLNRMAAGGQSGSSNE